ncbi:ATPase [Solemya velum gill symbiont]|uniref:V-type ATP synthase subunit A n=1 Tax=Solemya velum gill symbiont TaxID=2340 RepID=UPI000997FF5A|nr:V-type ATP synthase subunit A [Solemya velum gill symbiont]OOZ48948.1 ATPase [Solemya velum gill symbiont]
MSEARINWISGPVLRATSEQQFHIHESIRVGEVGLLGEVIRINGDEIVAQVYEDTSGLRPGEAVFGSGSPLSVRLGPGLLGNLFDGLLRPLTLEQGNFVKPGIQARVEEKFGFTPRLKPGDQVEGGAIFGTLNSAKGRPQYALVPPWVNGEVTWIDEAGEYPDDKTICIVKESDGKEHQLSMCHDWPVREPRPIKKRMKIQGPLLTGQRILDSLFPLACGGRAAMPGGFGTGKTVLQETLAKWCDADVIVYVGCGERGNEMAGVLDEFPQLEDPHSGRQLMERTLIIANTSNMPVAAREASIYTAVTVAEYLRDQGLRVALMADSTSRWAEALREVSGRLGELPGESGYPAYLSSRLADFYERAAAVHALCGKTGSVTLIGAISPPGGDFSEPVTTHTKRYTKVYWTLDSTRAQARFYPAVHPLLSYSEDIQSLVDFWKQNHHPDWLKQRRRFLSTLEDQQRLERMARIIGKDALPPRQQHTLMCAELINEAFLRQSAFSDIDRYCSPQRQAAMMCLIHHFIVKSEEALERGVAIEDISSMPLLRRLQRMGEEIGEDNIKAFTQLSHSLDEAFSKLKEGETDAAG